MHFMEQIKANEIPYESIKKDFPKIQRFYPAIGEIRAVELNEYAKAVGIDVQKNIQEDMKSLLFYESTMCTLSDAYLLTLTLFYETLSEAHTLKIEKNLLF